VWTTREQQYVSQRKKEERLKTWLDNYQITGNSKPIEYSAGLEHSFMYKTIFLFGLVIACSDQEMGEVVDLSILVVTAYAKSNAIPLAST